MKRAGLLAILIAALGLCLWQISKARRFQILGDLVARVDTDAPLVALTFDDGPVAAQTGILLATLAAHDVRATFFVTGHEAEDNADALRAIAVAGHEIGNHSYSHQRMILIAPETARAELARTDAAIRAAGYEGPIHFRPPFGKRLFILPLVLAQEDRLTVMWDVAPDEDPQASAEEITRIALSQARPGSIILLHAMYASREATRQALPGIIQGLRERGFAFTTVSQLRQARRRRP